MLSDDDLNIRSMSSEELDAAWDLWFDLAQQSDPFDPPYTHGVFVGWQPPATDTPRDVDQTT
jgi:myosin-crossreactive antigen